MQSREGEERETNHLRLVQVLDLRKKKLIFPGDFSFYYYRPYCLKPQ